MFPAAGSDQLQNENDMNLLNQEHVDEADQNLAEQTTLLNNEEESFALAPVDASALKGIFRISCVAVSFIIEKC